METNHSTKFIATLAIAVAALINFTGPSEAQPDGPKHGLYVCTEDEVKAPGELVACSHPGGRDF